MQGFHACSKSRADMEEFQTTVQNLKFSVGQSKVKKKVRLKFQFPCLKKFGSYLTSMGTFGQFLAFLLSTSHFAVVDAKKPKKEKRHMWVFFFSF